MKSALKKIIFICFTIFSVNVSVFSKTRIPELTGPVVDEANLLSKNTKQILSSELQNIYNQGGPQIAVLTIKTLNENDIETYSMQVAESWKIGSKDKDDGVILLIALKEKKIRIEVGYALEGQLTDSKCGLIIRNVIAPSFRSGNYEKGILNAVKSIENVLGINSSNQIETEESSDGTVLPSFYVILVIFGFIYFFIFSGVLSIKLPWLKWLPWASLFHSTHSTKFFNDNDDFHFGGGGFSGGSRGGFSGGGGSFGGGGASGGW